MKQRHREQKINDVDGVRIDFDKEWVHLRKSNTEAIIRVYAESRSEESSKQLAGKIIAEIKSLM
jgi:phosphomannomutase